MEVLLPDGRLLEERWLTESFARAGGPGGQNVNKVSTRVLLRFDLQACDQIPEAVKLRLRARYRAAMTGEGAMLISCDESRLQSRNRVLARERLAERIAECWRAPKRRVPTRTPRAVKEKRLESKRRRGETKRQRRWKPGE